MTRAVVRVAAVLEGSSDQRTAGALLKRLLADERVELVGHGPASPFLAWSRVAKESAGRVPRYHGHFNGEPGVEDALTAVRALLLFNGLAERPAAVVLVRDSDGRPEDRRRGLSQAKKDRSWPFAVAIGVAHHMREAWLLAGFLPEDDGEKKRLEAERKSLGFSPVAQPHLLHAKDEQALKSAKRVLSALVEGDCAREERCIEGAPLEALRDNGAAAGLSAFMDEVLAMGQGFAREV